ncbi:MULTISPECIES: hypothetical protein [Paraburkholderia]|uniref:hypothetical protein n=1 Tax=Paraburkholderia TaxID=1822464 RepID=UPI0003792E53|nr:MULTISPECIES: hypothetical protein [Paraburkholderia]MDH6147307.1 hypothetical protein [Paraburkholderia sp. WSM4179]
MPGYIAEFGGKYCAWSTVTNSPTSTLMTEWELFHYLREKNPATDWELFQARMACVREFGCSGGYFGFTKADLLAFNGAGPNETCVATEAEMVALYKREYP